MKYICASHGCMASGMKNTIEMILGKQENVYAVNAYVDGNDFAKEFQRLLDSFDRREPIVVFTDVFSGSINQIVSKKIGEYDMKVLTGVNLSLVLEIVMHQRPLKDDEIKAILEQAKEQIIFMNSLL